MASITIRRLDDAVKTKLRLRAARYGRSMEEEAREILKSGVSAGRRPPLKRARSAWSMHEEAREILKSGLSAERRPRLNLAESIRRHIDPLGGVDLALPRPEAVGGGRPPPPRPAAIPTVPCHPTR